MHRLGLGALPMVRSFGYLMLFTASLCAAQQSTFQTGAWVPATVRWRTSQSHARQRWARLTVLYFSDEQSFGMIDCSPAQTESTIKIGDEDVLIIYLGRWSRTRSTLHVSYRLLFRAVPHLGNDPIRYRDVLAIRNGAVTFRGQKFRREPRLDSAAISVISDFHAKTPGEAVVP